VVKGTGANLALIDTARREQEKSHSEKRCRRIVRATEGVL
jgi:hypothetical protein